MRGAEEEGDMGGREQRRARAAEKAGVAPRPAWAPPALLRDAPSHGLLTVHSPGGDA